MSSLCNEHLENLANWQLDRRVVDLLAGTGFEYMHKVAACRHDNRLLEAVASKFDDVDLMFKFKGFDIIFGLSDILHVTGLHITGKPVTGVDDTPEIWSRRCLGIDSCMKERTGVRASIKLSVLKNTFMDVPENASREILERHARAYVLYVLGSSIFSNSSKDEVPTIYLPLLYEVAQIKSYAWGAAALAHLLCSLTRYKRGETKSLDGTTISLQIFFMIYLPPIKNAVFAEIQDTNGEDENQTEEFPLLVSWSKKLKLSSKNTRREFDFTGVVDTITPDEVEYDFYTRLPLDFLPPPFKVQLELGNVSAPLINFNELAYFKAHKCKRQYPDASNKKMDLKLKFNKRCGKKGKDWTKEAKHKKLIKQWEQSQHYTRPDFAIVTTGADFDHAAEDDLDNSGSNHSEHDRFIDDRAAKSDMASRNQNRPPCSPSNSKGCTEEVPSDKLRRIGTEKGVRGRAPSGTLNSKADSNTDDVASIEGSECSTINFTREDVEALLNEKMKKGNPYDNKEKMDQIEDLIKRLKLCIRWYKRVEEGYIQEKEKLQTELQSAEKNCTDTKTEMKNTMELNETVSNLRMTISFSEERITKEESDKLDGTDSYRKEKEARSAVEQMQACLSTELEKVRDEKSAAERKAILNEDLYKRSEELYTRLQQHNSRLQSDLETTKEAQRQLETEKASIVESLSNVIGQNKALQDQLASLKASDEDLYKRSQELYTRLQQYNSCLQSDLETTREAHRRLETEKASIVESLSNVVGHNKELQDQLASLKETCSSQMEQICMLQQQLIAEKMADLSVSETRTVFEDQKRTIRELQEQLADKKFKEYTGKSCAQLDNLTIKTNALEETCCSQREQICMLQQQLIAEREKSKMADLSVSETRTAFENQQRIIRELQERLADKEFQVIEGEKLRKKLHNTILELKGNIRVFCRVRPLLPNDGTGTDMVVSYPTSTEALGRSIELVQSGQKYSFTFDKVFDHEASQQDVFVEISQLVQSALDGYKVCIFAYGQTGSGKTYTMMGKPEAPGLKGLIPRSLEQIFQISQSLKDQGWKHKMQASILEIYNETIRDLLSSNRSSSIDLTRTGTCGPGKKYTIKHDANGNTHVSDLTIVDVCSVNEISSLLQQAAQSRSVGRTQMNEQSSRSHFVFTLRICGFNENTEQQVQGVLNLIDLAGSERLSRSGATGDRLKETQAINKSLSSLSDVIFALAKKEEHVPFRNSKLTYLLQPCLGGDSKTLVFVNISPDPTSTGESLCSLRFAARVNSCEIGIPRRLTPTCSFDSCLNYG